MSKFNEIINGDKPVLIDFSAEWCQPCLLFLERFAKANLFRTSYARRNTILLFSKFIRQ